MNLFSGLKGQALRASPPHYDEAVYQAWRVARIEFLRDIAAVISASDVDPPMTLAEYRRLHSDWLY